MPICINKLLKLQNYAGAWAVAVCLSLTAGFPFTLYTALTVFYDLLFLPGDLNR
jgi:hypothetical protein